MDNITQWIIWGSLYTLITWKHTTKHFMLGAGITNIPDLDVFVSRIIPFSLIDAHFFHRGISHSIIWNIGISLLIGYILYRIDRSIPYRRYTLAVIISIIFWHLLVDWMTSYGMRYRLPWSWRTYSSDNIFIIDFGMRIITISGFIVYLFNTLYTVKKKIILWILWWVMSYIFISFGTQYHVNKVFSNNHPIESTAIINHKTIVEPFQIFLRRHIVQSSEWYYSSYYSLFDNNTNIIWKFSPENQEIRKEALDIIYSDTELIKQYNKINSFARNYIRISTINSGYLFENLISWPMIWRKESGSSGHFNFMLSQNIDWWYYFEEFRWWNRILNTSIWRDFRSRVWWNK